MESKVITPIVVLQDLLDEVHRVLTDGTTTPKSEVLGLVQAIATLQSAISAGLRSSLLQ